MATGETAQDNGEQTHHARPRLRREAIVGLAIAIADREGLDAVSFRRLATELGATPMALYRHVRDKADLLDSMADTLLGEIAVVPDASADWLASLRALLQDVGRLLDAHPSAAPLLMRPPPMLPNVLRLTETTLELLHRAGFSSTEALALLQQLTTLLVAPAALYGTGNTHTGDAGEVPTSSESADVAISPEAYPRYAAALAESGAWYDPARDREFSSELFLAGIEALARRRATPRQ
jgi:TetR/AcrR family tetracycline transcriptional repressor